MAHIPDGLDDTFSNSLKIKKNCTAEKFIGDGSSLTGIGGAVDWTISQAPAVIHADNYTDTNTQLSEADITTMGFTKDVEVDWTADQSPAVINAANYVDNDTTYVDTDWDHNSLTNTHNLTTDIDHDQLTNYSATEHFTEASISHLNILNIGTRTHAELETSCALINPHITDATIHFTSNALWTAINANTTSCALIQPHLDDTSDPHGANTTQTGTASFGRIVATTDETTASMAYIRNIVLGTAATPPTASNFNTGTLYVQYTA